MDFDLEKELGLSVTDSGNLEDHFEQPEETPVEEEQPDEDGAEGESEAEGEGEGEGDSEAKSGDEEEASVEAPAESSVDESAPQLTPEQAEIARLRQQLEEANARFIEKQVPVSKPSESAPPTTIQARDFLPEGVDVEDVLTDKNKLNNLLNQVFQTAVVETTQRMALSLPDIVEAQVRQQTALRQSVESFYTKHPHLTGFKRTVSAAATEVAAANPDWSVDQVFEAAATKATELIGLQQQVASQAPAQTGQKLKSPALAPTKGGRGAKGSNVTKLQQEIAEMLEGI